MNQSGIHVDCVSFAYQDGTQALRNIYCAIAQGSFVGITGSNGSGKTSLVQLLNGLIPHHIEGSLTGTVSVDGLDTRNTSMSVLSRRVGVVFQNPEWMICNLTVAEEVAFGPKNLGLNALADRVDHALAMVGLSDKKQSDPNTLSLGQKQKLAVACVIAMDTPYIVLDEPSAMLDYRSATQLYDILQQLHQQGKTVIVVEHDTDFLFTFAQSTVILEQGEIVKEGPVESVFADSQLLTAYGIKIPRKIHTNL